MSRELKKLKVKIDLGTFPDYLTYNQSNFLYWLRDMLTGKGVDLRKDLVISQEILEHNYIIEVYKHE